MAGRLSETRAIVTGASRGLGRALAEALAAEGARLALTATRREHLDSVAAGLGAAAHPLALDLSDPASVDRAAAGAVAFLGRVDLLVNSAGLLGTRGPLVDQDPEEFARVVAVNLTGTVRLIQRVAPAMAEGGAIVNVTSGAAGRPDWGAYSISKLAIEGVTGILREELAERGVRCVAINPGPTRTAMRAAAYPREDPATVPHPSSRVAPFLAVAAGADPGPRVEAAEWS